MPYGEVKCTILKIFVPEMNLFFNPDIGFLKPSAFESLFNEDFARFLQRDQGLLKCKMVTIPIP
jgi:hypothetical protein